MGNALSGLADYLFYPALMLVATPWLAGSLGLEEYGLWILASAVGATLGSPCAGLGDATVKYVSESRATGDHQRAELIVRTSFGMYGVMALLLAVVAFVTAPWVVDVVFSFGPEARERSITAIRLAGAVTAIRTVSVVFVSALRGYERYGVSALMTMACRLAGLGSAVALASQGYGAPGILAATLAVEAIGVVVYLITCWRITGFRTIAPTLDRGAYALVFRFASYSSLGATGGALFSHLDRVLIGALLGPREVAAYSLCTQLAQQIHSLSAAGFNFVFPLVSRIAPGGPVGVTAAVKRLLAKWLTYNVIFASSLTFALVLGAHFVLSTWLSDEFAAQMSSVLAILAIGFGVLAVNVVPHNALLGLGDARFVAFANLAAGTLSALGVIGLVPVMGLRGAAFGRLLYGLVVSANYLRVAPRLR